MAIGGEGDFAGKLRLPLPETFSGNPADWEEWSWNFKAYISMFETGAVTSPDHYLISQLVKDSAKLIVRQKEDSNGFETWRRFYKKFSLPGGARHF